MKKRTMWLLCSVMLMVTLLVQGALAADLASIYQEGDVETTDAERETGNPIFVIEMEDGGTMRGELYPDLAPESVGNFIALANSGFYDGLTFHRVIPGFVIQGGDPNGSGSGGPGWNIKGEFASNGVENDLLHTYGVLSMARAGMPDSAGSQFFVMVGDAPHLDGDYAAFGLVTEGMDVADAIVALPRNASDRPDAPPVIKRIRVETFGVDYPFEQLK